MHPACPNKEQNHLQNSLLLRTQNKTFSKPASLKRASLVYATFWFRPILSELIVAARESAEVNRKRAPSGPVKVVVTNQPHSRRHTVVDLVSGTTPLLACFRRAGPARSRHVFSKKLEVILKPHRRFPSPVPIEHLRDCREMWLIKSCRRLNLLTRMLQD